MNKQRSSEQILADIAERATQELQSGSNAIVCIRAAEALAMVECVEALQSIVLDMESGWIANHSRAAEKNYELLLSTALEALRKFN